jgi:hypothetical protein
MTTDATHIQLQTSVGDFDASFVKELRRFQGVMEARGLDPSSYIISKDRVQFTSLPFFVRPGGDGFSYTVFIDGESFSVTKANDLAFLGYFEQLCAAAIAEDKQELLTSNSPWARLAALSNRIEKWFGAPLFKKPE